MNLGNKIKEIRTAIIRDSQAELSDNLNIYTKEHFSKEEIQKDNLWFNQSLISKIENNEMVSSKKLLIIINYFHIKFSINPSWIIVVDNNAIPFSITKVTIDNSLIELKNGIEINTNEILKKINDVNIIIQNSVL